MMRMATTTTAAAERGEGRGGGHACRSSRGGGGGEQRFHIGVFDLDCGIVMVIYLGYFFEASRT